MDRYTTSASLYELGEAYKGATELLEDYYNVFYKENRLAAEGQADKQQQQQERLNDEAEKWLMERVGETLGAHG
jgi:hypothetical protein